MFTNKTDRTVGCGARRRVMELYTPVLALMILAAGFAIFSVRESAR